MENLYDSDLFVYWAKILSQQENRVEYNNCDLISST